MNEQWQNLGNDTAFDWDDIIQNDGPEYILLPKGEYNFTITKMERQHYPGGTKMGPCPKAVLSVEIDGGDKGRTIITHNLFLHSRCEGFLCEFFTSIGQRKHGEPLRPRWQEIVGAHGRCKVDIHEYTKNDGTAGRSNEISKFLPPEEPKAAPAQQAWTQGHF